MALRTGSKTARLAWSVGRLQGQTGVGAIIEQEAVPNVAPA